MLERYICINVYVYIYVCYIYIYVIIAQKVFFFQIMHTVKNRAGRKRQADFLRQLDYASLNWMSDVLSAL